MENYCIYHLHSDLSTAVTNIDSVTKYQEYIVAAQSLGMEAMAFSEHGSVLEWYHKKTAIEDAGMKYIHAAEVYLTESLNTKFRDNYHCVLIARNYDGFLELNSMITNSFCRSDNHFYYVPRISFGELFKTSENIIVTTACIGGVIGKAGMLGPFVDFLEKNKERCFLEIGHHPDEKQKEYNQKLLKISKATGIPLIAGTDTHVLNAEHEKGRSILQQSKNIFFDGEEGWDLKLKSYSELIEAYAVQDTLPGCEYRQAIENTNLLADMVEPFRLDTGTKYPHIYSDPEKTFRDKAMGAIDRHPYALKNHTREELVSKVEEELGVYSATKSIDFMLMQTYLREWERENGIRCGPGRGSVSGSMIAYLLGITQMDSMKFDLSLFRFMNPSRVTNADIDTDYGGTDRDKVKQFLLRDKMNLPNIKSAEIITFNTVAAKGAVREVCRALYKDNASVNYLDLSSEINDLLDKGDDESARKKYPDVFEYVDIINGTIVSVGTHPSGVLISDLPIEETIGLCSVSTSDYPVSMINMKELDSLMYVKLDVLGLDNVRCINEACQLAGIETLNPDNINLEDEAVWSNIRDDSTLIFQWESNSAQHYLKQFMSPETLKKAREHIPNFSMLKWFAFGNGLLRPACASFRDQVANGEFYDNGFDALNEFLAPEAGRLAMQETIMKFLVKFCGYSDAESDTVRRAIAKKKGTETLLPEIEKRFIEYCPSHYEITREHCQEVIKPFIQIILDASAYGFSWNHAYPYACIGYISGYLRTYYPYEFLTASLNAFVDDEEKTAEITEYATNHNIRIITPKWGLSKGSYFYSKDQGVIAKGLKSVKYLNDAIGDGLFDLSHAGKFDHFMDLLSSIRETARIDTRQLEILIKIDYFSSYGNPRELLRINDFFEKFKRGELTQIKKEGLDPELTEILERHATGITKTGKPAKTYTITDMPGLLSEIESAILAKHLDDFDMRLKIQTQLECLGYIDLTSGKPEDRRKLIVTEVYPLVNKDRKIPWAYAIQTRSIGTGKVSRLTVRAKIFDADPIVQYDTIYASDVQKMTRADKTYWYLLGYRHVY